MGSALSKTSILCHDCDKKANDDKKSELNPVNEFQQQSFQTTEKEEITEFDSSPGGVSPIGSDFRGFLLEENDSNGFKEHTLAFDLGGKLSWIEKEILKEKYMIKSSLREQSLRRINPRGSNLLQEIEKSSSQASSEFYQVEINLDEIKDRKNNQYLNKTSDLVDMKSPPRTPSLMRFSTLESPSFHHRSYSSNMSDKSINLVERLRSEASSNLNYNTSYEASHI
ncbi:unnamed protein product [Blepharisma stoltei]|uniref:Uncharacterized protein n=1 Tax=Blepharisma stoltei TaxID=1481888 RepID=A0AAU9IVR0_9CILI|nr:unnamed protein product [Blepharisma stoltei]